MILQNLMDFSGLWGANKLSKRTVYEVSHMNKELGAGLKEDCVRNKFSCCGFGGKLGIGVAQFTGCKSSLWRLTLKSNSDIECTELWRRKVCIDFRDNGCSLSELSIGNGTCESGSTEFAVMKSRAIWKTSVVKPTGVVGATVLVEPAGYGILVNTRKSLFSDSLSVSASCGFLCDSEYAAETLIMTSVEWNNVRLKGTMTETAGMEDWITEFIGELTCKPMDWLEFSCRTGKNGMSPSICDFKVCQEIMGYSVRIGLPLSSYGFSFSVGKNMS